MKKRLSKERKGELYNYSQILLWSFFPIISILAINNTPPILTASLSTLVAGVFFAITLTTQNKWKELKIKSAWPDILKGSLIIGAIFYPLLFLGYAKTSAGNASIIMQSEILFAFLILCGWKKEKFVKRHFLGAIFMVIGAIFILFPGTLQINQGDLIILIAAAVPPIGNYYQKRAVSKVSTTTLMFVRSILSGTILLGVSLAFEPNASTTAINKSLPFLLINGILLLGLSKIFWLEAIHRISINKATSMISIGPAFTLLFAAIILKEIPTEWQIAGFIPIFFGIQVLTTKNNQSANPLNN